MDAGALCLSWVGKATALSSTHFTAAHTPDAHQGHPIRINLRPSPSPSVGAGVDEDEGLGRLRRPRPVPLAHILREHDHPPPRGRP